jgi:quinoprotein glucose dehydrogenase
LLWGGDAANGRKVFFSSATSCQGCHYVEGYSGSASNLGPNLTGVGRDKSRDYLLESILNPSARIADGYGRVRFSTLDGKFFSGTILKDNEKLIRIVSDNSGASISIDKSQIKSLSREKSAMPDWFSKVLKPEEIRDLVEYLSTEYKIKYPPPTIE